MKFLSDHKPFLPGNGRCKDCTAAEAPEIVADVGGTAVDEGF